VGRAVIRDRGNRLGPATVAIGILVSLGLLWAWAAWRHGAYFGADGGPGGLGGFYPAAIAVLLVAGLLLAFHPWSGRLQGAAAVAIAALALLAAWTAISVVWTTAREEAIDDAERYLFYAFVFGLGLLLCNMLGRRMAMSLLPPILAGAAVSIGTALTIGFGDDVATYVHGDGSLRFPLGYHSATAVLFLVSFFASITVAADRGSDWRVRAVTLGVATLALDLAVLCQSRGSIPAFVAGLVVLVALHPCRVRAGAAVLLAAAGTAAAMPWLLDVYATEALAEGDSLPELRHAAIASGISALVVTIVGAVAARADEVNLPPVPLRFGTRRAAVIAGALTAIALAGAFVAVAGNPVQWASDRLDEFESGGGPSAADSRFTGGVASNRNDFWRVAIDEFSEDPVRGGGAGSFRYAYLKERDSVEAPDDPHGIGFTVASELGLPGLALLVAFLVAATIGSVRSSRLGPSAALLTAGALTAGASWIVGASYDWGWTFPALSAPVIALLGASCAPALVALRQGDRRLRWIGAAAAALLALTMAPLYLSERYADTAFNNWREDPARAYADLDRAADLNPVADQPLIGKALIALQTGDGEIALEALDGAAERKPEEWTTHYYLGTLLADADPARAISELETARRLNPGEERVEQALSSLRSTEG
jgi:hypothetical protein